ITVGAVQLEDLEPRVEGVAGRGREPVLDRPDVVARQLRRHQPALAHRLGTGRDDAPGFLAARPVALVEGAVAVPWPLHARLASGMSDLDARHRAIPLQEGRGRSE